MRPILLFFACICSMVTVFAQGGSIYGKITDSTGKHPLPLTTVTIFIAKDTTIITYRLTTEGGDFKIPNLPFGVPLRLLATFSGYEGFRKEFTLESDKPAVNFGTLKMVSTSKQLDEVIVMAERPPVMIKKDTIEFNASAFKTLPNALVEDLLKKLPGVQVDDAGNITVNGQKVNRILVNNKRFFGDDPKMATRNLPSNFIDKVQVMDDKDQIALNNDGDMSQIGKVINLTLKKDVRKGWFGKLAGGAGTNDRYELGGIANIYRDTLQLNVVGFANNINKSSFSPKEIIQLGGFERSGTNSISISTGGGRESFSVNGINFGGTGNGVTTSDGGGFNLNHAPNKDLSFFAQYFYGHSRNDILQTSNSARFIDDTTINTRTNTTSLGIINSHNTSIGGNWRADSLTNINFSGSFVHTDNGLNAPTQITIDNSKIGALSNAYGSLFTKASNDDIEQDFSLTHRFKGKKTRNFSMSESFEHITNPNSNTTETLNQYYYPTTSSQVFSQLRSTESPSTNFSVNGSYSDVLTKKLTFRANTRVYYNKQTQDVFTYGKHLATNTYDSLNYALSNSLQREQTSWSMLAGLSYRINKVTLNFSVRWLQQWINNAFGVGGALNSKLHYSNLLPAINGNWKKVTFGFSQDYTAPNINYLIPVPDNSNPFNILYGNPDLRPSKRTAFNLSGTIYNTKTNLTFTAFANASKTDDAVVQNVIVNGSGIQSNTPVNVNGVYSGNVTVSLNKQFKNKQRFIFTIDTRLSANYSQTPIFFNMQRSTATTYGFTPSLGLSFNWHDVFEINPRYNPSVSFSRYSNKNFYNTDIVYQNLSTDFVLRLPKKIVWESNFNYRYNNQTAPGLPRDYVYWNAAVSLLMMKEDKGQLKLAIYDILNQNNSYFRFINANSIVETRTNVLNRYISLTFIYNVRALGAAKQKVGGKQQSIFMF